MNAQSSYSSNRPLVVWKVVRPGVGIALLVCELAVRAIPQNQRQAAGYFEIFFFAAMCVAAAVLAYKTSRTFAPGQTGRFVWLIIALMPLSDGIAYVAYTSPDYLPGHAKSLIFIAGSTVFMSLSRIFAVVAFLSMLRVYKRTGLKVELRAPEYMMMVFIILIELISLVFASPGARASGGPDAAKLVLITAIPLVIALVPCSILGVIIWRYTTQMGGGLVAKAWRNVLLYGLGWLSYTAFHAVIAYYYALPSNAAKGETTLRFLMFTGVDFLLKGGSYLMFLGASFQYEACTGTPDFSGDLGDFTGEELSTAA
jgi:hypothetical protein